MTATRDRIVEATSTLFMQQGYAGSGLKQISEASAATTGSLYHCFPGGKAELAAATLRHAGRAYQQLVEAVLDSQPDVVAAVDDVLRRGRRDVAVQRLCGCVPDRDGRPRGRQLRRSAPAGHRRDLRQLAGGVDLAPCRRGLRRGRGRELATVFLAALEGGFLLSRVAKDTTAMHHLGKAVAGLVAQALASSPSP